MRKLALVAALTAFSVSGFATAKWDYETFAQRLIDKKIQSVEAALAELPVEYWSYYVLVRDSRSSQGASAEFPRVILSGLDGSFLLAFNGDPKLAGHDTLEMIQVRDGGQRFEMRQIRFPAASNKLTAPEFSVANPKQCLSCHQKDPRPNWEQYSTWTGSYGEKDDVLTKSEATDYRDFLARHGNEVRYRRLLREDAATAPFVDGPADIENQPNRFFTKLVARWNAKRMTKKILNGLTGGDRLAPLAALYGCDHLSSGALAKVARVLHGNSEEVRAWLPGTGHEARGRLLTAQGVAPTDWSLLFNGPDNNQGAQRTDRYFDGLFDLGDLVEYDLIKTLVPEFPELVPVAEMSGYLPDEGISARRAAMIDSINALGGVPFAGSGAVCSAVAKGLSTK